MPFCQTMNPVMMKKKKLVQDLVGGYRSRPFDPPFECLGGKLDPEEEPKGWRTGKTEGIKREIPAPRGGEQAPELIGIERKENRGSLRVEPDDPGRGAVLL